MSYKPCTEVDQAGGKLLEKGVLKFEGHHLVTAASFYKQLIAGEDVKVSSQRTADCVSDCPLVLQCSSVLCENTDCHQFCNTARLQQTEECAVKESAQAEGSQSQGECKDCHLRTRISYKRDCQDRSLRAGMFCSISCTKLPIIH